MARSITLYAGDYNHTIRARTYCATVANATTKKLVFKKVADSAVAELDATVVAVDTDYYAVDAITTSGWTDSKAGEWIGQVQLTFSTGLIHGESFRVVIKTRPTAA